MRKRKENLITRERETVEKKRKPEEGEENLRTSDEGGGEKRTS